MSNKGKSDPGKKPTVDSAGERADSNHPGRRDETSKSAPADKSATKPPSAPPGSRPATSTGPGAAESKAPARKGTAARAGKLAATSTVGSAPDDTALRPPASGGATGRRPQRKRAADVGAEAPKNGAEAAPSKPKTAPRPLPPLAADGDVSAVVMADHRDPFGFLGMHELEAGGPLVVRTFIPWAEAVRVFDSGSGKGVGTLSKIHLDGLFAGVVEGVQQRFPYRLLVETEGGTIEMEDPYRFPPVLAESDVRLLAEGNHLRCYERLGAHVTTMDGVAGVAFAVWAPNAGRVSVVGDFNDWDGRRHGMRLRHDCGVWEIFIPGIGAGALYKYEIKSGTGVKLTDKGDPFAFLSERSPGTASIVCDPGMHRWRDDKWMKARASKNRREAPMTIYEVHLGSWRRNPEEGHRWLTYTELADVLVGYVKEMGFTHVELLPVSEFDFDGSLGYQPYAPYAPTSRWGTPDEFRRFVDRCHEADIGVIADWVPIHFSDGPHGLAHFDGTPLYEHPDPRQRRHPGWNTLTYDYGRREVANYLLSNALFWLDRYHLDGLRLSALASMLYLDYGRARGEWTPNRDGGPENLEAVDFLKRLNEVVPEHHAGAFTVAEENSGWPNVTRSIETGGLGFGFKWNGGWVRETLRYMSRNPVHRKYYHDELTHRPATAFDENFVLPLSHEEVGYGRGSMLRKMPGDRWQRFANLRLYYTFMYTMPGKKLLFMGDEFAQEREWNPEISLDWHLLDDPMHLGVQRLVHDLNRVYRSCPALFERDCDVGGFSWIDANDTEQSIISYLRHASAEDELVAVVCNFTPVVRKGYRIGVPQDGFYEEVLNSDAERYGGGNVGSLGGVAAEEHSTHGRPYSLSINVPPFAAVVLRRRAFAGGSQGPRAVTVEKL